MNKAEIHDIRLEIQHRRERTNELFMDWWEKTMNCPHCSRAARMWQGMIAENDDAISEANEPLCE